MYSPTEEEKLSIQYAQYLMQHALERYSYQQRPMSFEEWDVVMHDYE